LYLRYAGAYVVHKGAPAERILIIMEVRIISNIEQRKIKFDVRKKKNFEETFKDQGYIYVDRSNF
jgi:hypothetical protein